MNYDPKQFIGTTFTSVSSKNIHCNICDQLCKFLGDENKTIENHMLTMYHVTKLQTFFIDTQNKKIGQRLLFSLQMAKEKEQQSFQELDNYLEQCICEMSFIKQLTPLKKSTYLKVLQSFYIFLLQNQKELLDPQDIVMYLKNQKEDIMIFKQLLKEHNLQFNAQQNHQLAMLKRVNQRKAALILTAKQCEIYYNKMIYEFQEMKQPILTILYMLIRLPFVELNNLFEIKVKDIAYDAIIQLNQIDKQIPIPLEIQKITQKLIDNGKLDINEYIIDYKIDHKDLNRKITKAREYLQSRTSDQLYKTFLQNASLNYVKHLNTRWDSKQHNDRVVKKIKKIEEIQQEDSEQFIIQLQL